MPWRMTGLLAVMAVACGAGVATDAWAGCGKDTDCKGNRVCVRGECVDAAASGACESDKDCSGDLVCARGECASPAAPETPPTTAPPPPPAAAPAAATAPAPAPGPSLPPTGTSATELNDPGMLIAGIVLLGAGTIGTGVGLAFVGVGANNDQSGENCYSCNEGETQQMIGGVVTGISAATLITGIILTIVGAQEVPAGTRAAMASASARVVPTFGPTGGNVSVVF